MQAEPAGLPSPTRLTRIHAALGKCRPWHLTVGYDNASCLFFMFWWRLFVVTGSSFILAGRLVLGADLFKTGQ